MKKKERKKNPDRKNAEIQPLYFQEKDRSG